MGVARPAPRIACTTDSPFPSGRSRSTTARSYSSDDVSRRASAAVGATSMWCPSSPSTIWIQRATVASSSITRMRTRCLHVPRSERASESHETVMRNLDPCESIRCRGCRSAYTVCPSAHDPYTPRAAPLQPPTDLLHATPHLLVLPIVICSAAVGLVGAFRLVYDPGGSAAGAGDDAGMDSDTPSHDVALILVVIEAP